MLGGFAQFLAANATAIHTIPVRRLSKAFSNILEHSFTSRLLAVFLHHSCLTRQLLTGSWYHHLLCLGMICGSCGFIVLQELCTLLKACHTHIASPWLFLTHLVRVVASHPNMTDNWTPVEKSELQRAYLLYRQHQADAAGVGALSAASQPLSSAGHHGYADNTIDMQHRLRDAVVASMGLPTSSTAAAATATSQPQRLLGAVRGPAVSGPQHGTAVGPGAGGAGHYGPPHVSQSSPVPPLMVASSTEEMAMQLQALEATLVAMQNHYGK